MVAMNVWPTDGADGSVATEARWRKMARHWAPTEVAPGVGNELYPTLAFPNLTIDHGAFWIDGHYAELLGSQVLAVTANGLVVVRFDPAANTAELLYRDGVSTPAQDPNGVYEMPVAQIAGSALVDVRPLKVTRSVTIHNAVFDANGLFYVTPANVGLTTLDGLVWNAHQAAADPTGQPLQVITGFVWRQGIGAHLVMHLYSTGTGTLSRLGGGTITEVFITAWGRPGPFSGVFSDEPVFADDEED